MLRRPASTAITSAALRLGVQRMPTELGDFFATNPVDPSTPAVLPPLERRNDFNLMRPMEPRFAPGEPSILPGSAGSTEFLQEINPA